MNKDELINRMSIRTNTTKCKTTAILDAIIDVISDTLSQGNKIQIVGFGTFETRKRAEKKDVIHKQNKKLRFLLAKYQYLSQQKP